MWAPNRHLCWPTAWALSLLASILVAGCTVGPNFRRPDAPAVASYARGGDPRATVRAQGTEQHFSVGAVVAGDWWQLFKSDKLSAVVGEALVRNPGLEAAQASLRQSEDALRSGYGIFYPNIAVGAAATRQRYLPERVGQSAPSAIFNLFTLSASVGYALDVFGGERRTIEALHAQVEFQRATEQATYITLLANMVNTVVACAGYRAQIEATQELVELQRQEVGLAEVQVQAGTAPYSTVLSLKSQLASTEATVPQLEQRLVQSDDLLATLSGYAPAEWQAPEITFADLTLPAELPVSVPSELIQQRPDILIAEAAAHAASANVGVATAALLPSVTLSGDYSANATRLGALSSAEGRAWNLSGGLTSPLFDGGTLWFRRKAAIDSYQQAMARYRQTVLAAFGQVADGLRALEHDAAALRAEDEALRSANLALRLVHINYEAGIATYLDVLNADGQYHQTMINDLQSTAVRYQDTVALYVALGGGWWSKNPSQTAFNAAKAASHQ